MKITKAIIATLVLSAASFTAMAATEITKEEAAKYASLGVVSASGTASSPGDLKAEFAKLAEEKGGDYFVIIADDESRKFNGSAEVFK